MTKIRPINDTNPPKNVNKNVQTFHRHVKLKINFLCFQPSIVPVKTLIARERSGTTNKALNLLSTEGFEQEPEIYELDIMQPPTRDDWITGIRDAVDAASPGSDSDPDNDFTNQLRKSVDNKYLRLRRLTAELRGKDIELCHVLEFKMKIMNEILEIVHGNEHQRIPKPDYVNLVREKKTNEVSKEHLLVSIQEASRLASSIYSSVTNLSRSVSSAGEKHSNVYSSPSLPRRAETFSGFDQNQKPKIKEIDIGDGGEREIAIPQVFFFISNSIFILVLFHTDIFLYHFYTYSKYFSLIPGSTNPSQTHRRA